LITNEKETMSNEVSTTVHAPSSIQSRAVSMLLDPAGMGQLMKFAELMSRSAVTVPTHLVGKPSDCLAVALQAMRWGMDPFAVAQKTHVVSGRLGYEAQLVNAVVQSSGAIKGSFHYEYEGKDPNIACRVGAVLRGETEITWGEWLSAASVTTKNSPLWKTNPRQQMGYLQVKNWARLYAPGAILGVYSTDELAENLVDMGDAEEVAAPPPGPRRLSERTVDAQAAVANSAGDADVVDASLPEQPAGTSTPPPVSADGGRKISAQALEYLRKKLAAKNMTEAGACERFNITSIEQLTADQFDTLKADLLAMDA
jgi:hypothetical protein